MMAKLNKLGLLSLLALIGIFGLVTPNKGFIGFFGFLGYLPYFRVVPDEKFIGMVHMAGSAGFFGGIAVTALSILITILFYDIATPVYAFAAGFAGSVVVFSVTLQILEYRERRGM